MGGEVDLAPGGNVYLKVRGGDHHDDLVLFALGVEVHLGAQHLVDFDGSGQLAMAHGDVLGTDARHDVAGLLAVLFERLLLEGVQLELSVANLGVIFAAFEEKLAVIETLVCPPSAYQSLLVRTRYFIESVEERGQLSTGGRSFWCHCAVPYTCENTEIKENLKCPIFFGRHFISISKIDGFFRFFDTQSDTLKYFYKYAGKSTSCHNSIRPVLLTQKTVVDGPCH